MKIEFRGLDALQRKLENIAKAGPQALAAALYEEAEAVMTASKEQHVPVDTGALRASGHVEPPRQVGNRTEITMGYGGPAAPYAVIVHEDLTKRHPVGGAKYLEIPLRARLQGMPSVLAMRVREGIRQNMQRLGRVEANVRAGRDVNWGMPGARSS